MHVCYVDKKVEAEFIMKYLPYYGLCGSANFIAFRAESTNFSNTTGNLARAVYTCFRSGVGIWVLVTVPFRCFFSELVLHVLSLLAKQARGNKCTRRACLIIGHLVTLLHTTRCWSLIQCIACAFDLPSRLCSCQMGATVRSILPVTILMLVRVEAGQVRTYLP